MVQRGASTNKRATGRDEEPSLLTRLARRLAFPSQAPQPPTPSPPSSGYEDTPPPTPSAAAWAAESPRASPSTVPLPWSAGVVESSRDSPASVASPRASSSVASPRAAGSGAASVNSSRVVSPSVVAARAVGVDAASPSSVGSASPLVVGSPRASPLGVARASPLSAAGVDAASPPSVARASQRAVDDDAASPSSADAVSPTVASPRAVDVGAASPSVAGSPRAAGSGAASTSDASPDALGLSMSPRSLIAGHSSPTGLSSSSASPLSSPCAASPAPSSVAMLGASSAPSSVVMMGASPAPSMSIASGASPAPSSGAASGAASGASPAPSSVAVLGASPSVAGSPRAAVDGAASTSPSVASSSSSFGPGTMKYVPGVGGVTREEFLAAKTKKRPPSVDDDAVSVSSNESAATRARYKKLGYDTKTVRKPPQPPARHPSSGHKNTYDPDEDTDGNFPVRRLLDRRGKPPKLFYLVEWESALCKLSWVLESDLINCESDKQVVDDYKASRASRLTRSSVSLTRFSKRYREATASVSGLCFFEAIQAAVFMLGRPGILPLRVWGQFEETRGAGSSSGVSKSDMSLFFRFLRTVGCPIDIPVIQPNRLNRSTTSLRQLVDYTRSLPEGWYVVHAGEYLEEHCFALRVQAAGAEPIVIDRFVEAEDPPCQVEPVDNLQWIRRVMSIRRVQLLPDTWVFRPSKKRRNT